MTTRIEPHVVFRIYPDSESKLYCNVTIWKSVQEMHEGAEGGTDYDGMCTEIVIEDWNKGKHGEKKPVFAEMHLALTRITIRIITHEVFHATLYWMRRRKISMKKIKNDMKTEESCAYAYTQLLDNLIENFHTHDIQVSS